MPIPAIAFLATAATWLGRIGLAAFAVSEVKKLTQGQKNIMSESIKQAEAVGITDDEQKKLIAATTYEQVEMDGQDPDDFWEGLDPKEQEALKFSPKVIQGAMQRTSFLGIAQTVLWVAAGVIAGIAAFRGIPIVSAGLGKLIEARARGATALELMTFVEETKMLALQKVWVPGFIATIAGAGGWLTGMLANNLNDAFLWGRIFLDQAHSDVENAAKSAKEKAAKVAAEKATSLPAKTIIRMVETKEPQQFIGTLFSAKLGKMESFNRVVDDEITNEADLLEDVKLNLNKWLVSLPGRLGYSVVIRKDPVDSVGVKQSGTWATLTTHFTRLNGAIQPIDTILLGPVTPATKLKLTRSVKTVEQQIPKVLTAQEVRQIEIPNGAVDIFGVSGERVDLSTPRVEVKPEVTAPVKEEIPVEVPFAQVPTPAPTPPKTTLERATVGIPTPPQPAPTPTPTPIIERPQTPTPTPAPIIERPQTPTPTPAPFIPSEEYLVAFTNGQNLNMRDMPNLRGTIIEKLAPGILVKKIKDGGTSDGFEWWNVESLKSNRKGYVASKFLRSV